MTERSPLPYGRHSLDEDDIQAVVDVLRGDWLTTGPLVEEFENALCRYTEAGYAVAVSSGTAALHSAYFAAGVGPRAEVITSPLSFVATASCALHLGARLRFADIDPDTGNLSPAAVSEALSPDTKLIVAVDYAGHPADYPALRACTQAREISLIADAAHSLGARRDGLPVGTLADATTTSFHPVKGITTAEGGAVLTAREDWARRAGMFRNHGIVRDTGLHGEASNEHAAWYYEVQALGLNYRLPDVLCALGLSQLRKLDSFLSRRREIAARYGAELAGVPGLSLPVVEAKVEPSWHLYAIRVKEASRRDALFDALRKEGLGVQLHYFPIHLHPAFQELGYARGSCPVAESFCARLISLPIYPGLTDADVNRVIETVANAAQRCL